MIPTADVITQDTVYSLASTGSLIYAARQSGLWCSLDGGITWQDAFKTLQEVPASPVTAIAVQGDTLFAGVKGAIICSRDAGVNWNIVGLASPAPTVTSIAISPNFDEDATALVGTADDGVFVSIDRGTSWTAWNFGLIDAHIYALAFSPNYHTDKLILAGTESGVFSSKSGGRGWNETDFPMSAAPVISLGFVPTLTDDNLIFAGTESNGLFRSTASGTRWQPVENAYISGVVNAIVIREKPSGQIYLLLEDQVIYSTDNGITWQQSPLGASNGKLPISACLHSSSEPHLIVGFVDGDMLPM